MFHVKIRNLNLLAWGACVLGFGCTNSAEDCEYTASCGSVTLDAGPLGGSGSQQVTRSICQACSADSDCADLASANSLRCVPMTYRGTFHGNYCLSLTSAGACSQPYMTPLSAASVSGAAIESYCGIDENTTTCEAVLDLTSSKTCARANNCGSGQGDGLCQNLGGGNQNQRCTIPCAVSTQCLLGQTCSSLNNGYCR